MSEETITLRVGKNGITDEFVKEAQTVLKKHKKVRIKLLKSSRGDAGRHELADQIKEKIRPRNMQMRGNILTLEKP